MGARRRDWARLDDRFGPWVGCGHIVRLWLWALDATEIRVVSYA